MSVDKWDTSNDLKIICWLEMLIYILDLDGRQKHQEVTFMIIGHQAWRRQKKPPDVMIPCGLLKIVFISSINDLCYQLEINSAFVDKF